LDPLAPDLVLFGGDLLNLSNVDDPQALADARRFMEHVRSRYPLHVVLGNPTVEDRETVTGFWRDLGIAPLDGALPLTIAGAPLVFFGLPADSPDEDALRLERLIAETATPEDTTRILLYHLPDLAGHTPGIDLYLAGHTHGGQIRLPLLPPLVTACRAPRRLASGTHLLGETLLHTSRGLGLEGLGAPRMRFFCPPEVTLIELVARPGVSGAAAHRAAKNGVR
jgi:predicted MPP superfamily phosphohydrolase